MRKGDLVEAIKNGGVVPAKAAPKRAQAPKTEAPKQDAPAVKADAPQVDAAKADAAPQTDAAPQRSRRSQSQGGQPQQGRQTAQGDAPQRSAGDEDRSERARRAAEALQLPGTEQAEKDAQDERQGGNRGENRNNAANDDDDERGGRRRRGRGRGRGRGRDRDDVVVAGGPQGRQDEDDFRDDEELTPVGGIVDILDNYAFVRTTGYLSGKSDVYVSMNQIKKYGLRKGDAITGSVRPPRPGERGQRQKFNALATVDTVNGVSPEEAKGRKEFGDLTPLYPQERLHLETESRLLSTRVIDIVAPIGKGQRGLIVSPPKAGKTLIMQNIANAIVANNPEVHLMVVLVDERPEEVTDFQRSVKGEVIASTFDRPAGDHTQVAEPRDRARQAPRRAWARTSWCCSTASLAWAVPTTWPPRHRAASCPVVSTLPRCTRPRSSSAPRATSRTAAR
ncbi:hypothetical protein GCM10025876_28560 [Demequina litorisediminis]|uniref:Rho RNA-BD domain-containing protein n=1 Tax=Demequina litorisediminis TaxID=1849022 RepID=A0ABQ6IIT3_9MICO|nr:hypothetical protein GCM10025876_28560 [Demequina litorisediminis]